MSKCTLEQRQEALNNRRLELETLVAEGASVDDAIQTLNDMQDNIRSLTRMKNIAKQSMKKYKQIPQQIINKLNSDNPRNNKNSKITIVSGYIGTNGRAAYKVKFPRGKKEYTIGGHSIVLDTTHAQGIVEQYGLTTQLRSEPTDGKTRNIKSGTAIVKGSEINNMKKLLNVVDDLIEIDNIGTTKEHENHIKRMIRKLVNGMDAPIEAMNVYLNDKANKNHGFIEFGNDKGIYLSRGYEDKVRGTDMSLAEMFLHELIHGASHYALNSNNSKIAKEIDLLIKLKRKALNSIVAEDLLGDIVLDRKAELEIAQSRLDYMKGKDGLEEFLAMAISNKKIFDKLKNIKVRNSRVEQKGKDAGLLDAIMDTMMKMIDTIMNLFGKGESTMRGDRLAMKLVSDIGKMNRKSDEAKIKNKIIKSVDDGIHELEERLKKWLAGLSATNRKKVEDKINMPKNQRDMTIADNIRLAWYVLSDEKGTPIMQEILSWMGLAPHGTMQTIIKHMKHADTYGNTIQDLIMASGQIDMNREETATRTAAIVNKAFGMKKMKARKRKTIYKAMMMHDGIVLVDKLGEDLSGIYSTKTNKLDKEIEKYEDEIRDMSTNEGERRSIIFQAAGLAELMSSGSSTIVQRKNSDAIIEGVVLFTNQNKKELSDKIDILTSLYGIKKLDDEVRNEMADVVKNEYESILAMSTIQLGFREYMKKKLNKDEWLNLPKNYNRETYDNELEVRIESIDSKTKQKMKEEGYKLADNKLPPLGLGYDASPVGLYVSEERIRQPHDRSMIRYTGHREPGESLLADAITKGMTEAAYDIVQDQIKNGLDKAEKLESRVRNGDVDIGIDSDAIMKSDTNVIPVVDSDGKVVDYRTQVSTYNKIKYMGLEADSAQAIGRSWSHERDLEESSIHNANAWDALVEDMVNNVPSSGNKGRNQYKYVDISKMSSIAEVRDSAKIIPSNIKLMMSKIKEANKLINKNNKKLLDGVDDRQLSGEGIEFNGEKFQLSDKFMIDIIGKERWDSIGNAKQDNIRKLFAKNSFKVRHDMLLDIFGVRSASATDLIPANKHTRLLRKAIRMLENGWKEIVKIFKVDMIIRTLPVIFGNIVSNLMYSVQYGLNPIAVAKVQLEGIHMLKRYLNDKERLADIDVEIVLNKDNDNRVKELEAEKNDLNSSLKYNPAKPLLDEGLYSHIVEDVNMADFKSNSRIATWIDNKTEGVPEMVKTAGHWMFVSERTSLFQLITKATAYSDFVARYAQYTLASEKARTRFFDDKGRQMNSEERQTLHKEMAIQVRDAYINYAKPDSKLLQYANDMGFVAFTKYAVRIQLGIADLLQAKPLRFTLAMLGQELFEGATGINPDDIVEKSILSRNAENWMYSPGFTNIVGSIIQPQMVENVIMARDAL